MVGSNVRLVERKNRAPERMCVACARSRALRWFRKQSTRSSRTSTTAARHRETTEEIYRYLSLRCESAGEALRVPFNKIGEAVGVSAASTAGRHVRGLEADGKIERIGSYRALIRVI
jgi:hypothetical protein